jgi:hypothetical protein
VLVKKATRRLSSYSLRLELLSIFNNYWYVKLAAYLVENL